MVEPYQPIYTVREAAKLLKVNNNTVYAMIKNGQLTALKLGAVKIRGKDLEKFINGYPSCEGKSLESDINVPETEEND